MQKAPDLRSDGCYDEVKEIASYVTKNTVKTGGFAEAVYKFIEF